MPRVGPAGPSAGDARRPAPAVRLLDALAGVLSAGVLVVGALLLVAQLFAPALLSMAGWGEATGPGWPRVAAHLVVGVAGEVLVRVRGRLPAAVRVGADFGVVIAALVTIGWAWWP
jgi:hypothetical protein